MVPESAAVVIVGGGAMGASTAYHLAKRGVKDVVLLERETLGSGSTSKSAGGIRAQFADELNVRIALRSMAEFQALDRVSGIDYKRHGYLFLLTNEVDAENFRSALVVQQKLGVPSQMISPDDVKSLVPGLETSAGRIRTDTVICAAGVWSRDVGNLAGLDIPVRGEARWMHFTPEDGGLPEELPLTVDFATGFYFHREGEGLVFGGREPTIEGVASHGTRRLPVLAELPIQSSWWGFYEMSPDNNAIVGEVAQPRRFLYATGFSGHGFQQAPAVGEHLAELVVGAEHALDLSPLALERFDRGGERRERFVV